MERDSPIESYNHIDTSSAFGDAFDGQEFDVDSADTTRETGVSNGRKGRIVVGHSSNGPNPSMLFAHCVCLEKESGHLTLNLETIGSPKQRVVHVVNRTG